MWKPLLRAAVLAALPGVVLAAGPLATATIVDGEAEVVRESAVLGLMEGVRLEKNDLVHTAPGGRFVRLEFTDGVVLDIAPGARLMLSPRLGRALPQVYLLSGAVKVTAPANVPVDRVLVASPRLAVSAVAKGVVIAHRPEHTAVFAETGTASLVEREGGPSAPARTLGAGHFYQRAADGAPATWAGRPTGAFIQSLPRAFLDTLPSRLPRFAGRDVPARPLGEPAYETVQPWIDAEAALRPQFVARFRGLAKRPPFRAGLVAGLAAHPEWDRTLYPEKYRPAPPRSGPAPAVGVPR